MLKVPWRSAVAIGEAMIELAPVEGGLYRRGFAGDTFNTIWHMAQLAGEQARCGFVSRIGEDSLSSAFAAEIASDGLDVSGLTRDARRNMGLYLIELDGVERSFHYWRQHSAARLLADDASQLSACLRGKGLIHLSGITLAILSPAARLTLLDVLAACRAEGAIVSFDPNYRPRLWSSTEEARESMLGLLAITDVALASFDDEKMLWADSSPLATLHRLLELGVREVVVKNGAAPVHYRNRDGGGERDTPPVTDIKDTTGAGDAFNAGYLTARLLDRSVEDALGAGQMVSALVLRHFGARAPANEVRKLRDRL